MLTRFWRDRKWRSERREFIYLDEVSVTSLIAARDGEIADTVTEKLARSAESESKVSASVPISGAKLGSESRQRVTDTSSREVVRRAVIQSTFRDLRTGGKPDSLPLVRDNRDLPKKLVGVLKTPGDLSARTQRRLRKAGALIPLDSLKRGDVIEIDVQLRPNKLFSFVSAIESFADMMQGRPGIFGDAANQVGQVTPIAEVIDRLMVGLVPIHGTPTNFAIVNFDERPHIIDTRVILSKSEFAASAKPFELVALTETDGYWKDLRRVLFTQNRYSIYARVVSPGLQEEWNPVKLADVMSDVSADLAKHIRELPKFLDEAMGDDEPEPALDIRGVMHQFADAISQESGVEPDEISVADTVTAAVAAFRNAGDDLAAQRGSYDLIVRMYEGVGNPKLDRNLVARVRAAVEHEVAAKAIFGRSTATTQHEPVQKLEVEVVAIYW